MQQRQWSLTHRFVVWGAPGGYYTQGKRPNWTRMRAYIAYKNLVQSTAMAHGVKLPLVATRDRPLKIHTVAYFQNGVHPDPENVRKGIVDALFYARGQPKGSGDKHVGGSHEPPLYDKTAPRVEVIIEEAV